MANNTLFIGKYRLTEEIASGAYGRVYRAADTSRQNTVVAIKLMQATRLSSAPERNGFLQEAQFLKMLQHPYILSVLDVGIESDVPYIVTEFAPNGSLLDRQKKLAPRPLPVPEVMKILAQIGQALQYAHQQNIIHRDLKPANILFHANGDALLADFGIATMLAASIKYGTAIGTPYYMAPEQFRGSISKEGDQYALGCIAYELYTGRLPFTAPDFFALGFKHMSEVPLAPTQLNLLMPRSAEQAILKAMAKQRADRHADISAFLLALGISGIVSRPATPFPAPFGEQSFVSPAQGAYQPRSSPQMPMPISREAAQISMVPAAPSAEAVQELNVSNPEQGNVPDQSEPDEPEDATVVRALYSKKPHTDKGRKGHMAVPGKSLPYADTLPRVVEGPLHVQRMPPLPSASTPPTPPITAMTPMTPMTPRPSIVEEEMVVPYAPFPVAMSAPPPVPPFPGLLPQTPNMAYNGNDDGDDLPNPLLVAQQWKTRRKNKWLLGTIIVVLLLLLVLSGASGLYILLSPAHGTGKVRTTVTITPVSNVNIGTTYTFYAVVGQPDPSRNGVAARMLSATFAPNKLVAATGAETVQSSTSRGTLTFYNDSAAPQTFAAGGIFSDRNGVAVTNDAGGTVPAGNPNTTPPTWRAVTVSAHAVTEGNVGNIPKAAINTWKALAPKGSFVVQNDVSFTGGQDAQTYSILQQADLTNATNSYEAGIYRAAQTALTAEVQPGEKLFGTPQCSEQVQFDHPVGSRVAFATASFVAHCTAEAYDNTAVQSLATKLLQQKMAPLSASFQKPTNQIVISILQANAVDARGTLNLLVDAEGLYVYQFSATQKNALAVLLSGKSRQDAQALLLKQTGVRAAAIGLSGGDGHTLSSDPGQITINVLSSVKV